MKKIKNKKLQSIKEFAYSAAVIGVCSVAVYPTMEYLNDSIDKKIEITNEEPVYSKENDSKILIPEVYKKSVNEALGYPEDHNISKEDLRELDSYLLLTVKTDDDLSFLDECTNLNSLYIVMASDNMNVLSTIDNMPNLNKLSLRNIYSLANGDYSASLNVLNGKFIFGSKNFTSLDVSNINIDSELLKNLPSLSKLNIEKHGSDASYYDLDYNVLTNLESLSFSNASENISDIATFLDSSSYNNLIENGVEVKFSNEDDFYAFMTYNSILDTCMYELNLSNDMTDSQKIARITSYVLDNLVYDETVANNLEYDSEKFYKDGFLYGAFMNETQICGNYAALFQALAKRAGVNSNLLISPTHAWNVVSVEGDYYIVDSTWLDLMSVKTTSVDINNMNEIEYIDSQSSVSSLINSNNTKNLNWYLSPVNSISTLDTTGSHNSINIPSYINIIPLEEVSNNEAIINDSKNLDRNVYEVNVDGKTYLVNGAILIGLALFFGAARALQKRKKEMKREQISDIIEEIDRKKSKRLKNNEKKY